VIVFEPAPRWKRLLAALVDILLAGGSLSLGVPVLLVVTIYQSLLLLEVDQTVGMRLFGLFVNPIGAVRVDRLTVAVRLWAPVTIAAIVLLWDLRRGGAIVGGALCLDLLWLAFPGRRCFHDVLAATQVLDGGDARRPVEHARIVFRTVELSAIVIGILIAVVTLVVVVGSVEMFFRWFGHMG
jgi:hypothetical protein